MSVTAADHSRNPSMSSGSRTSANPENDDRTVTSDTSLAGSCEKLAFEDPRCQGKAESVLGLGVEAHDHRDRGKRPRKPDSRFYSGRNPVPKIESLWDLFPDRTTVSETREETERKRKIEEHSEVVSDPITGKEVKVCDARYVPPVEIEKTRPNTYPPIYWIYYMEEVRGITVKYICFVIICFVTINGVFGLPHSISIFLAVGGGVTWWRKIESAWAGIIHQVQSDSGKQRMVMDGPEGNESVEWLNGIIANLWPQVNADIFTSAVDLIEDIMQASIPSIVSQVKISNIGQGTTPIRILSMRWLNEDRENQRVPSGGAIKLNEQEEVGEWVSLEVAFSYRAKPSSAKAASKAKNAHLLLHMSLGLGGVLGALIPVWVELRGITGICRLKVQLIPDPPFIKLTTFSLMGMPKIDIAAVPLNQKFVDVMNLPVISDFVHSSIRTAAREFVAPSNFTLDMSKILVGDDTKKELSTVGVLVVHIHSAEEVMASDLNGKSDCYVTLSYTKFAKPLWSTRIIFEDLNPVWDETAVVLVNADEVKAGEKLSVDLWDSDRFTADDILGHTEVDITMLIRNRGKKFDRRDKLMGVKSGQVMPGRINWSVTFWGKSELNRELATDGSDERLPKTLQYMPEFKSPVRKVDTKSEARVAYTPPDPRLPSGILSIQIHNIVGLERQQIGRTKSTTSNRKTQVQCPEEEESEDLPSAYCSIILDYQKIYKTRIKPMTSKPFFNAGTERFIGDWTKSSVLVVVKDQRMREIDPILGVVEFKLVEVLQNASMISRFYPLQGGVGCGKIRISLLFRAIEARLPRGVTGGDTGEVEIVGGVVKAGGINDEEVKGADCLIFKTPLGKKEAKKSADGNGWVIGGRENISLLGVRYRYSEKVVVEFRREGRVRRGKGIAVSVLWLKDIVDAEEVEVKLPVFKNDDAKTKALQNCMSNREDSVGHITFKVKFRRGLGASHAKIAEEDRDFADVIEAAQCLGSVIGETFHVESEDEISSDEETSSQTQHTQQRRQKSTSISRLRSKSNNSAPPEANPQNDVANISEDEETSLDPEYREEGLGCGPSNPLQGLKRKFSEKRELQKELHRRERGIMQWKGARTLAWMGKGVRNKGRNLKGKFNLEPRMGGVESEVR